MSTVEIIQSPAALVEVGGSYGALVEVLGVGAQGPSGGGGGGALSTVQAEVPTGIKNGANRNFTLAHAPLFLVLVWGGIVQSQGVDYTIVGDDLLLLRDGPLADDVFTASYIW